jgi:hypothetical protein
MRIVTLVLVTATLAACAGRRQLYPTQEASEPAPRVYTDHRLMPAVAAVRAPILRTDASLPAPEVRGTALRVETPPPPTPPSLELLHARRTPATVSRPATVQPTRAHQPAPCAPPAVDMGALFANARPCSPPSADAGCCPGGNCAVPGCCPGGNCGIPGSECCPGGNCGIPGR